MKLTNDVIFLENIDKIKELSQQQIESCIDYHWRWSVEWNTPLLVQVLDVLNEKCQARLILSLADLGFFDNKHECNKQLAAYIQNFLIKDYEKNFHPAPTQKTHGALPQELIFYQLTKFIAPCLTDEELLDIIMFALKDYKRVVLWIIDMNCWDRLNEKQIKHLKFLYKLSK